jgi:hypothetical protein
VPFTVTNMLPTLASVSPSSGVQGTSVPVTLTGTNFVPGSTVWESWAGGANLVEPGFTVSGVTVVSATQITATVTMAANLSPGVRNLAVTTSAGISNGLPFTVNPPPPTLTSVTPATGLQGASVPVTLTGTNFVSGATVAVGNPGITVGSVTVVSGTQITATLTIAANAALGAANVTVTTSGGTSGALTFTVNAPPPTLTIISPATGVQGASVPVTIAGTNFVPGATVAVGNPGITVGGVTVVSGTQITATLTIAANAAMGAANVTVTTSGGISGAVTFTVNPPAPTLTSVTPASGAQGASVPVTLTGTNFVSGATVALSNPGIAVTNVVVASTTQITATLTIAAAAALGAANVTVTTSGGASGAVTFTVNPPPPPIITSLSTSTGAANTQVTINGSGFGAQATGAVWLGSNPAGTVVSWSDLQIVATVACNATSGTVRVRQGGAWSNASDFTVNTATISTVAPDNGVPGVTAVTITGTGFGAVQGAGGQVWLGTANGVVQSWSDTQVVATVGMGATSGSVLILQGCVMSNAKPFTVNRLHIDDVTPNSGLPGTLITITGTGFGASQGIGGVVWLGSTAGQVVSWSDTQVVATVAATALTGVAKIQPQNGAWSNAKSFTVPVPGGNSLVPNAVTMMVGDTRKLQALSAAGQPATGLTWTPRDSTVVSLSSDDPPLLTALAPGHVTITAGTATADVTVWAGALPVGTVLWSNPGNGSGVKKIVPAVPSPSGVADVFAFQADGTVQAITADGTTAWTADVSKGHWVDSVFWVVPDFQGGLVVSDDIGDADTYKLDGITGRPYPRYTPSDGSGPAWSPVVHPDGTIFTAEEIPEAPYIQVTGIDPSTGAVKFRVPADTAGCVADFRVEQIIIAGDGYAYMSYECEVDRLDTHVVTHLGLLRVNTSGQNDQILDLTEWDTGWAATPMITNADQGILLAWYKSGSDDMNVATATGGSLGPIGTLAIPGGVVSGPLLQTQDGTFITSGGTWEEDGMASSLVAFDATGNVRWMVPGNYWPMIATADGGVIAKVCGWAPYADCTGPAVTFDQNGNATGQLASLPTQSWTGYSYQVGSIEQFIGSWYLLAAGFWELEGGQYTPGGAGAPIDSIANKKARDILTKVRWQKFAGSNCGTVFKNALGLPLMIAGYDPTMQAVQVRQGESNFYDVGNPDIGTYTLQAVTRFAGHELANPVSLTAYLGAGNAAVPLLGRPTPVVLRKDFFKQPYPQFTLIHEVLLHAYAGQNDDAIFGNTFFTEKGLWRPPLSTATTNISTWMSTDCTCTPEKSPSTCPANTAKW